MNPVKMFVKISQNPLSYFIIPVRDSTIHSRQTDRPTCSMSKAITLARWTVTRLTTQH